MAKGIHLAQFYLHEAKRLTTTGHVPAKIDAAERLRCWLIDRWEHGDIALIEIAQRSHLRNTAAARTIIREGLRQTHRLARLVKIEEEAQ